MRLVVISVLLLATAALAGTANASQLIDRNATHVELRVNAKGEAMISYRDGGKEKHVLASGAVNAIPPSRSRDQVAFKLSYSSGGAEDEGGECLRYDGPPLAWKVAACKAPDGSYWALQSWQRELPDYGVEATAAQSAHELRLSHWTGPLPVLTISTDWAWHRWDHLYGTFAYRGKPVYGFQATSSGNPLGSFGRSVYVDTYGSAHGHGWRRENSFLTHTGTGTFCYTFAPHGSHPSGKGAKYRATVEGPGVTPDVMWEGKAPGPYDRAADAAANHAITALGDANCKAS